jgi:hypothetical protein
VKESLRVPGSAVILCRVMAAVPGKSREIVSRARASSRPACVATGTRPCGRACQTTANVRRSSIRRRG